MSAVLVVGADTALVKETWNPQLAEAGIEVVGHWDWTKEPGSTLPEGCEGVVVLTGKAGDVLREDARGLAVEANIPFVVAGNPLEALNLLHASGIAVNGDTIMRIVDGKVVLPKLPTDNPKWVGVISPDLALWGAQVAHETYITVSEANREKIAEYVLGLDVAGVSKAGRPPRGTAMALKSFEGNPNGLAIFLFMCIPAGAGLAVSTPSKVYQAVCGKGMDGYPTRMAAWATGRRVRGRSEPSWNEIQLADVNPFDNASSVVAVDPEVEPEVDPVVEKVEGPSKNEVVLAARVTELEGEVGRLQFDNEAKKKAHQVTIGKLASKCKVAKGLEQRLKEVDGAGGKVENLLKIATDYKDERDVATDLISGRDEAIATMDKDIALLQSTLQVVMDHGSTITIAELVANGYRVVR